MHVLRQLTFETVDKYTIIGNYIDTNKYFNAGICNKRFGVLLDKTFECENDHTTNFMNVVLTLNLKQRGNENLQATID